MSSPDLHAPSATPDRLPARTYRFVAAQVMSQSVSIMSVSMSAVAGATLASHPSLATLPYGTQMAASLLFTYPASLAMKRLGRRPVFLAAALVLILAGLCGAWAMQQHSLPGLVLAHALMGTFSAAAGYYRFAALDELPAPLKPKALSRVIASGLIAALIAPWLVTHMRLTPGLQEFAAAYACLVGFGLATLAILWPMKPPAEAAGAAPSGATSASLSSLAESDWRPAARLAIACSAWSALVMTLLMIASSLQLKTLCGFDDAAQAIQWHVLAMFTPSFFTGTLISRFGVRRVLLTGLTALGAAVVLGWQADSFGSLAAALVVLGLGWSFTFVGGTTLLAQRCPAEHRHRWQGLHDLCVAACGTLGAFAPAPLLHQLQWQGLHLWVLPLAVIMLLAVYAGLRPSPAAASATA